MSSKLSPRGAAGGRICCGERATEARAATTAWCEPSGRVCQTGARGGRTEPGPGRQGPRHRAGHIPDRDWPHAALAPGGAGDETKDGLVELEVLLADGRYAEAIDLGEKLLSLGSSAYRLGPIRYHIARAYLQLGKPEPAGQLLRQASAHFESVGDALMMAECMGSQASLAYMTQQP